MREPPGGVKMPNCSGKIRLDKVAKPSTALMYLNVPRDFLGLAMPLK
jgi:hypothetical protein